MTAKTPTKSAYRTANFTASFSERVTGVSRSTVKLYRKGYSTPLAAAVTLSTDGRKATLNPSSNLRVGAYFTVRLTSGIKDRRRQLARRDPVDGEGTLTRSPARPLGTAKDDGQRRRTSIRGGVASDCPTTQ